MKIELFFFYIVLKEVVRVMIGSGFPKGEQDPEPCLGYHIISQHYLNNRIAWSLKVSTQASGVTPAMQREKGERWEAERGDNEE